jgi:hypothetical protein
MLSKKNLFTLFKMIMIELIRFLNRKYPFHFLSLIGTVAISFSIGVLIFVFEPFGFINYEGNKLVASLIFAFITFIALIIMNTIKKIMNTEVVGKWTIYKEIIFLMFVILIITFGNFFYLSYLINGYSKTISNFFNTLFLTFSIGLLPVSFIVLYRYNDIKNHKLGKVLNDNSDDDEILVFNSLNKSDKDVVIQKKYFLFIESIKNNVHIYFIENENIKTISIRNTLQNVENHFQDPALLRCHRSFIVNVNNIKTAKGNSNGYKIYFKNYNHYIPVSRSYTKTFQDLVF